MPFLSDKDAEVRLGTTAKNLAIGASLVKILPSRDTGCERPDYTEEQKVMIGVMTNFDGKDKVSQNLGISRATAESYAAGKVQGGEVDPALKAKVDEVTGNIRARLAGIVNRKIEKTLECLTDDKLATVEKATDLALIANSLARTSQAIQPEGEKPDNVHFHFYRPRTRDEDEFEIIDVTE